MKKHFNYFLLVLVCGLLAFSALFFYCLSAPASLQKYGNANYYFLRQLLLAFLPAAIAGFAGYKIPLQTLKKWAPWLVVLNIIALFMVFLPGIGLKAGGASRWLAVAGATVQPSEFLKITAILYLSAWIASKLSDTSASGWKSGIKKNYHNAIYIFLPFVIFLAVIFAALYLQKDASTLGIIALTLLAIYFSSKTPFWHALLITAGGAAVLLFMVRFEQYRLDRWLTLFNPVKDPLGKGHQLTQSIISLGSGGFWGKGLGMSTQKFGYLPQAMGDSIFAIIGEELGFAGCIILIAAFIALFW